MENIFQLKGKTVLITGGSRGIGLAIGIRLAKEGANIAIAAKTDTPHPKLPGTIYTACKQIEEAGGNALPIKCDIRNEEEVKEAIQKTVEKFGGLDILINNASAIWTKGTEETPMKKYDLMSTINARATFMTTKYAIPHLLISSSKGRNPSVLNISPPLSMKTKWFSPHTAYSMSKYGMSMCILGMSGEFAEQGIAFNALWPKHAIATAAIEFIAGHEALDQCRKPEVIADSAFIVLTRDSSKVTGNFYIDETLLEESGISKKEIHSKYSVNPSTLPLQDFFVDDEHFKNDQPRI